MKALELLLEHRCPDCPLCGSETWHDGDSLTCTLCGLYWPDAHGPAEPIDPDADRCGAEVAPFEHVTKYPNIVGHRYRCVRPEEHKGDHAGTRCDRGDRGNDTYRWRPQ